MIQTSEVERAQPTLSEAVKISIGTNCLASHSVNIDSTDIPILELVKAPPISLPLLDIEKSRIKTGQIDTSSAGDKIEIKLDKYKSKSKLPAIELTILSKKMHPSFASSNDIDTQIIVKDVHQYPDCCTKSIVMSELIPIEKKKRIRSTTHGKAVQPPNKRTRSMTSGAADQENGGGCKNQVTIKGKYNVDNEKDEDSSDKLAYN